MKPPKKTVQIVLDDENPEHAGILASIASARELCPDGASWTDSDIVNEALRVFVESKRREARFTALHPGHSDPDQLNPEDLQSVHVWLDDLRPAPVGWKHVYTAPEAIAALAAGGVEEISLDHDLGEDEGAGTGYDVAVWIENGAADGTLSKLTWSIHSANPVGRARMTAALESADRLWDRAEERA